MASVRGGGGRERDGRVEGKFLGRALRHLQRRSLLGPQVSRARGSTLCVCRVRSKSPGYLRRLKEQGANTRNSTDPRTQTEEVHASMVEGRWDIEGGAARSASSVLSPMQAFFSPIVFQKGLKALVLRPAGVACQGGRVWGGGEIAPPARRR